MLPVDPGVVASVVRAMDSVFPGVVASVFIAVEPVLPGVVESVDKLVLSVDPPSSVAAPLVAEDVDQAPAFLLVSVQTGDTDF